MTWTLTPGDLIARHVLHDQYGGRRQGIIGMSRKSPNVFLFTQPDLSGSQDGWTEHGTYLLHGEGLSGDQLFTQGNAAVLNAAAEHRTLRVFHTTASGARYVGTFTLAAEPYVHVDTPGSDGQLRQGVAFNLIPDQPDEARTLLPYRTLRPPQSQTVETHHELPLDGPLAPLSLTLRAAGHHVTRTQVIPAGETLPLTADLHDHTTGHLYLILDSLARPSVHATLARALHLRRLLGGTVHVIPTATGTLRADLRDLLADAGLTVGP